MPVVVVADYLNVSEEKRLRALFLSHLMAIYIHSKLPKLSALCAVTTASMGSCAGIAYLLTGKFETVSMGICSMIGDISGIICDGASNSCAMKVSTSVASGYNRYSWQWMKPMLQVMKVLLNMISIVLSTIYAQLRLRVCTTSIAK